MQSLSQSEEKNKELEHTASDIFFFVLASNTFDSQFVNSLIMIMITLNVYV